MKNKISFTTALLVGALFLSAPVIALEGDDADTQDNAPYADAAPADGHTRAAAERNTSTSDDQSPFAEATPPAPGEEVIADNSTTKSSVPVVSGGVGDEDMARMKSLQSKYNLKLLITEANGTFLSDTHVQIKDMKGRTLADASTDGPVFLAKLPVGKYKVAVRRHDQEFKERVVSVNQSKLSAYQITFADTDPKTSGDPKTTSLN